MLPVRSLVVALALCTVVQADVGAAEATRMGVTLLRQPGPTSGHLYVDRLHALRRQLAAHVPAGARVVVGPRESAEWRQRIVEIATLGRIRVTADRTKADFEVSTIADPDAIGGLRLVIEPTR